MINTLFIDFIGTGKDFDKIILPFLPDCVLPDWYNDAQKAHFTFNGVKKTFRINQDNNIVYIDIE